MANDHLATDIQRYYQQAFDPQHPLFEQLQPDVPYADDSLWGYYRARLHQFIVQYSLQDAKVLEAGCAVGFLQDMVDDYTGIDLAKNSGSFLHKPFVTSSVTALPFPDATFDAVWSIFVLEHIPDPEAMLREIRRVIKPNGLLFLCAAWNVPAWVAQGYDVRPFSDLDAWEKVHKLTVLPRTTKIYRLSTTLLQRLWRNLRYRFAGAALPLDFGRLQPNFDTYWSSDADACTAVDSHAVLLWMIAQGDQWIGGGSIVEELLVRHSEPLIFRIKPDHSP